MEETDLQDNVKVKIRQSLSNPSSWRRSTVFTDLVTAATL